MLEFIPGRMLRARHDQTCPGYVELSSQLDATTETASLANLLARQRPPHFFSLQLARSQEDYVLLISRLPIDRECAIGSVVELNTR